MRSTSEILQEAKSGVMPSHEECYYTMLALAGRLTFWKHDLETIGRAYEEKDPKQAIDRVGLAITLHANTERIFKDYKGFLETDPKTWLGPGHDPMTPEGKQFHQMAMRLLEKVQNLQEFKANRISKPGDFNS